MLFFLSQKRTKNKKKKEKRKLIKGNEKISRDWKRTYPYFCTLQVVGNDDVFFFFFFLINVSKLVPKVCDFVSNFHRGKKET